MFPHFLSLCFRAELFEKALFTEDQFGQRSVEIKRNGTISIEQSIQSINFGPTLHFAATNAITTAPCRVITPRD